MEEINYDPHSSGKAIINYVKNMDSSQEGSLTNSRQNSLPNSRQGSIIEHHQISSFMGSFVKPIIEETQTEQENEGGWMDDDLDFDLPFVEEIEDFEENQATQDNEEDQQKS